MMRLSADTTHGVETIDGVWSSHAGGTTRDDLAGVLVRELARALPAAVDQRALEELASRLCPYLTRAIRLSSQGQLITCAQAASRAHVHVETVRRAIRAGSLLVAARIGRSPRLTILAVDGWLAASSHSGHARREVRRRSSSRASIAEERYSLAAAFEATG
jgi:excisionase family DNA binding protein